MKTPVILKEEKYKDDGVSIINCKDIFSITSFIFKSRFYANNKDIFLKLFGRQQSVFTSEYRHYVWVLSFRDKKYYLLSGKEGTALEVAGEYEEVVSNVKTTKDTIALIKWLIKGIKKVCKKSSL